MTDYARAFVVLDHKRVRVQLITGSLVKAQECVRRLVGKYNDPLAGSMAVGLVEVSDTDDSDGQSTPVGGDYGPEVAASKSRKSGEY